MVCYRPEGLDADMRLHDEHQGERDLHQDPRVKSTMLYIVRLHVCIEVDVSRSHVVFKTLTCLYMCVHSQGTR